MSLIKKDGYYQAVSFIQGAFCISKPFHSIVHDFLRKELPIDRCDTNFSDFNNHSSDHFFFKLAQFF